MEKSIVNNTLIPGFKSGFIAIAGAPNVGKSTLLNKILGEKISITSRKPQTTRNRIMGVVHRPGAQLILIDTPGIHTTGSTLNRRMVDVAFSAMNDVDLILLLSDISNPDPNSEKLVIEKLKELKMPVILALNKLDLVKKIIITQTIETWTQSFSFKALIPISAKHGYGLDQLLKEMQTLMPEGPMYFPADSFTDMPERFIVAEIIREKIFRNTGQEVPYASAVTIDQFLEGDRESIVKINATIHIERDSQKAILIGKGGKKLKQIGEDARKDIERLLGTHVYLGLFVRVQKNWSSDTKALVRFGY